jgi:hypothetical protein
MDLRLTKFYLDDILRNTEDLDKMTKEDLCWLINIVRRKISACKHEIREEEEKLQNVGSKKG